MEEEANSVQINLRSVVFETLETNVLNVIPLVESLENHMAQQNNYATYRLNRHPRTMKRKWEQGILPPIPLKLRPKYRLCQAKRMP